MIGKNVQRVLERLVFEGLLIHNRYEGRRWRVTLSNLMEAGAVEPRVWELLPGILLHRPSLIFRVQRDLRELPELQNLMQRLPLATSGEMWRGLPFTDLRRAADRIAQLQQHHRSRQRWRNINIRVSEDDLERLRGIAIREGRSQSEILRTLIAKAAESR